MAAEPITAATLWAAYQSLPEGTRSKINKAAGKLVSLAAPTIWRKLSARIFGTADQRAMKRALRVALANAASARKDLDLIDVFDRLSRQPLAALLVDVVRQPNVPIDPKRVGEAFDRAGYDLTSLGVDEVELIRAIQNELLAALRLDPDPQAKLLHIGVRIEQTHDALDQILADTRSSQVAVGLRVGPATEVAPPDSLPQAIRALYRQGREAFVSGDLDAAEAAFAAQLQVIREGELAPGRPLGGEAKLSWERHAQDLLLSLAQVAIFRDNREEATKYLSDARALGEYEGRARYFAGWVLANLDRMQEARVLLEESDGTREWDVLRAIVYLNEGAFDRFRALCPDDALIEDIDILVSLVRYYLRGNELANAAGAAEQILRRTLVTPSDWIRAAEAGVLVLGAYAESLSPPDSIDPRFWISEIRRILAEADMAEGSNPMMLQRSLAWQRFNFHRVLLEVGPAQSAFSQIVRNDPAGAAYIVAYGFYTPSEEPEILTARDAAKDRVVREIVEALRLLHFTEDRRAALEAFEAVRPLTSGEMRNRVTAAALELRAHVGEASDALRKRAEAEISDHTSGKFLRIALFQHAGHEAEALSELDRLLQSTPHDLKVLRMAYAHVIELCEARSPREQVPNYLTHQAVELGRALVDRLPCPEHTIRLARALALNSEFLEAYELIHALDTAGYATRTTVGLLIDLTRALHRYRESADAADRYCREFDLSSRTKLQAAKAAAMAREFGRAREHLADLLTSEDPDIAENAYRLLYQITLTETPNDPAAAERSIRVLIDAYDRLGARSRIAGTLFNRALGSEFETEITARLNRDFGSISNLPGFVSITEDQLLAMRAAEERQILTLSTLYHAGLLTFEMYAQSHGEISFVWYQRWETQTPTVISPPKPAVESFLSDPAPRLLIGKTALLTLAETDLLEVIFQSDLQLAVEQTTLEWLRREELLLSTENQPAILERNDELLDLVGIAPEFVVEEGPHDAGAVLSSGVLGGEEAEHVRLALQNGWLILDDELQTDLLPEEHRGTLVRSHTLLDSLLDSGAIGYADAARASEKAPQVFSGMRGTGRVSLDVPLILTGKAALVWQDAGLLSSLTRSLPGVFFSPRLWREYSEQLSELKAYRAALSAITWLRSTLEPALESGRLTVAPWTTDHETEAGRASERIEPAPALIEELDRNPRRAVGRITEPIERLYRAAVDVGGAIWTDDAASHLYLDKLGPFAVPSPYFVARALELQARYPTLTVFGTPEILEFLEQRGTISHETRLSSMEKLVLRGRLLIVEPDLIQRLAGLPGSSSGEEGEVPPLSLVLHRAYLALPPEAVWRAAPMVMRAAAEAEVVVWYGNGVDAEDQAFRPNHDKRETVRSILLALQPWTSGVYAIYASRAFWLLLSSRLLPFIVRRPEALIATVLDAAHELETDLQESFLSAWLTFAEYAHGIEAEHRPLMIMLMDRLASVASVRPARRRPVLPDELARIGIESLGIPTTGTTGYEGETPDNRVIHAEVNLSDAEALVAARLNTAYHEARSKDQEFQLSSGRFLRTTVLGSVIDGRPDEKVDVEHVIEPLILLRVVEPEVQLTLARSVRQYYSGRSAFELAAALDAFIDKIAVDDQSERPRLDLLHTLLNSPRWLLEYDIRLSFESLYSARLQELIELAGLTSRWILDEDLASRLRRLEGEGTSVPVIGRDYWGPYEPTLAALQLFAEEHAPKVDADDLHTLVETAIKGDHPYSRIYSTFLALMILSQRPDLRDVELAFTSEQPDTVSTWKGRATDLIRALLVQRLTFRTAENVSELSSNIDTGDGGRSDAGTLGDFVETVLADEAKLSLVHELTYRLVHRAVWSPAHVQQAAVANQQQPEDEAAADVVGDLLLLGQLLTERMYSALSSLAEGSEETAAELADLLGLFPFHQAPNDPYGDLTVPDALGTIDPRADPYLTTLLASLERVLSAKTAESESAEPWWWSPDLSDRLMSLAQREPSQATRHFEKLATLPNMKNRLGNLMGRSAETRAKQILSSLQG